MEIVPFAASAADIVDAVRALVGGAGHRFDVPLLAVGLSLHFLADVVRNRGWYSVLRAASPAHASLRVRDVEAAAFAGAGINAVVPARAGDLVKVAVIRRRAPSARVSTVMATFLPETLFEWVAGTALLAWALSRGYLPAGEIASAPRMLAAHAVLAAGAAVAVAAALVMGVRFVRRAARRLYRDVVAGFAILRRPRAFVAGVASFQLAGRVIRIGAIACCLSACRLPGDLAAAAFVMAVDGGTRLRFAPATTALRAGLLGYGLPAAGGAAVSLAAVLAYLLVVRAMHTALALGIAATVLVTTVGAGSPRAAIATVRRLRDPVVEPARPEAPSPVRAR